MKKLINSYVLTQKHCQSMRMTGEAKPSETEVAEFEFIVSLIPVEKSKEEQKILRLSSALAELVVESEKDTQISNNEGVKNKR